MSPADPAPIVSTQQIQVVSEERPKRIAQKRAKEIITKKTVSKSLRAVKLSKDDDLDGSFFDADHVLISPIAPASTPAPESVVIESPAGVEEMVIIAPETGITQIETINSSVTITATEAAIVAVGTAELVQGGHERSTSAANEQRAYVQTCEQMMDSMNTVIIEDVSSSVPASIIPLETFTIPEEKEEKEAGGIPCTIPVTLTPYKLELDAFWTELVSRHAFPLLMDYNNLTQLLVQLYEHEEQQVVIGADILSIVLTQCVDMLITIFTTIVMQSSDVSSLIYLLQHPTWLASITTISTLWPPLWELLLAAYLASSIEPQCEYYQEYITSQVARIMPYEARLECLLVMWRYDVLVTKMNGKEVMDQQAKIVTILLQHPSW